MKKMALYVFIVGLFLSAGYAAMQVEAQTPGKELRPSQVAMRQRVQWLRAMQENLTANKFDAITIDAMELAAQADTIAEKQTGLAKELTMKLSTLAAATAGAASASNGVEIQNKLNEIKGVCGECHTKIRDKR